MPVRKILEKLKVRVTTQTCRAFWHYVQGWLLTACRQGNIQHESFSTRRSSQYPERQPAQSRCSRYGQAPRTSGHDYRPHQYGVSVASLAGDVCAWPDGLPPVHAYMGDERTAHPVTTAEESQSSVDLGSHHAAACPAVPARPERNACGISAPGPHDLATAAITAVLSLICLNGLSHLLDLPAETLLLATLPTLAFPLAVVSFSRRICPEGRRRFMPRNFFYYAYAGHLGIIGLIQYTFA